MKEKTTCFYFIAQPSSLHRFLCYSLRRSPSFQILKGHAKMIVKDQA